MVQVQRYFSVAIKYNGTSVRLYLSMSVYLSTTVPKYDGSSTAVLVRRYQSTTVLHGTTVLVRRYFSAAKKYDGI